MRCVTIAPPIRPRPTTPIFMWLPPTGRRAQGPRVGRGDGRAARLIARPGDVCDTGAFSVNEQRLPGGGIQRHTRPATGSVARLGMACARYILTGTDDR